MTINNTIADLLEWAKRELCDGESPNTDARILLAHTLNQTTTYLMTWPDKVVEHEVKVRFEGLVAKRKLGHPVAHLIGKRDFWTLTLEVTPDTLIPRPETELLVEYALELTLPKQARVLDLGTGTGAIALSLASEKPSWQVFGVDVVEEAVLLAQRNADLNQLTQVQFSQSSWFSHLPNRQFDLIVSNPPYVESNSHYLAQGDVRFEPASALTSGTDGLDDIKHIIKESFTHLEAGGWLVIEHGFNQAEAIAQLFSKYQYTHLQQKHDLNNQPRVSAAQKPFI